MSKTETKSFPLKNQYVFTFLLSSPFKVRQFSAALGFFGTTFMTMTPTRLV